VRTKNTIGAHQHATSLAEHTTKLNFVNLAWNIVRAGPFLRVDYIYQVHGIYFQCIGRKYIDHKFIKIT
jgi:hypothetical protein